MANALVKNVVARPLGALAAGLARVQGALYSPPDTVIPGMKPTDWPSPLQPVRPFGTPDAEPLGMNMLMGQNLIFTPRPDARMSAADLQALARYPLARICITNVLDTISSLRWRILLRKQPGEDQKVREAKQAKDDTIQILTDFLSMPDYEHDFTEWVRPLLNDMLTIDAGCVLLRKTDKTQQKIMQEWRVMQGAYITRLVDRNGYTPAPPAPAYQQLWDGIPRLNLTADQLIYKPRNIVYQVDNVSSNLYGLSPVEALADEIEVGIQRLRYVKAFYKDGSIPNVLWVVPANTSPDVVDSAMKLVNKDLSGNLESRRMFRFAQGFRPADAPREETIKQFEEPKLSDEYDDLHTRRICFGFGVSPQRLLRMLNRSTAQTNQEAAEEEGIAPYRRWVEDFINFGIQRKMGYDKYEFRFDTSIDPDPLKQAQIEKEVMEAGTATINELRIKRGDDPRPEPEADKLGKWLPTGWIDIGTPPATNIGGGGGDKSPSGSSGGNQPPAPKKKPLTKADAVGIPTLNPARDTIRSRNAKSILFSRIWRFFEHIRSSMVIVTPKKSTKSLRKDADDDERRIEQIIDAIMANIQWNSLPGYVQDAIAEAASDGATIGMDEVQRAFQSGTIEVSLSPAPVRVIAQSVISEVNQLAADYARDRSAEMVGMKWVDGELVQNPNAAMAITDSTRNMLRDAITEAFEREAPLQELTERIKNAGVFSEERAQLIADTEVKYAQSGGNYAAWEKSGIVESVRWLVRSTHDVQDECDLNEAAGAVKLGELFPSGVRCTPAHPQCFLPGTVVASCDRVTKHFDHWFEGKALRISVIDGHSIEVTPNHPILTTRGWIAAVEIREGDDLFQCDIPWSFMFGENPDNELTPIAIEQVSGALLKSACMLRSRVPMTPEDFHGDGADGEVDVVWSNSALPNESMSGLHQNVGELDLESAHDRRMILDSDRASAELIERTSLSASGTVSGFRNTGSERRVLPSVKSDHVLVAGPNAQSTALKFMPDNPAVDTDAPANIHRRFAGLIAPVKVINIEAFDYSGHVYNLETTSGFYFANGLIVHNCVCTTVIAKLKEPTASAAV